MTDTLNRPDALASCDIIDSLNEENKPTHVVTSISYGGRAVFNFRKVLRKEFPKKKV